MSAGWGQGVWGARENSAPNFSFCMSCRTSRMYKKYENIVLCVVCDAGNPSMHKVSPRMSYPYAFTSSAFYY